MDRAHRRLSELTSEELAARAINYRRMAAGARGEATVRSLNMLAARFGMLATKRKAEETPVVGAEALQDRSELDKLIQLAEQAAAEQPDSIRALIDIIKVTAEGAADPYVMIGVLVEGAVHTLGSRIPTERQSDVALAMLKLLADQLQHAGMLRGP